MKKATRAFLLLAIILVAVCSVFSLSNIKAYAADHTVVTGGSTILNGGPSTATIYLYKVTVYINSDGSATKESPYSKFDKKAFAYYYKNSIVTREINSYVGGNTKFDYAVNRTSLNAKTIKDFNDDKHSSNDRLIYNGSLPNVSVLDDDKMLSANKEIIKFFGADEKTRYKFAKEVCSKSGITITEDDSWALTVEPTIRSVVYGRYYYYTPTEYAVALSANKSAEGFGSYDKYNYTMLGYGLTLNRGASVSYISNGAWFGLGSGTVKNTWQNVRTEKAFYQQYNNYIKYAGVFVWFSRAFENSDFTLGSVPANTEKFEEEEITISTQVNRTNPSKAGTVTATLNLNSSGFTGAEIKDAAQKTVSFAQGETSKSVSWKVKVGSYGDKSTNRSYTYDINIAPSGETKDLNMNNNTISGQITLKRDLQVTSVTLDKSDCFENSNVKVNFSVKNANPYKAYNNVPVTVYFTYGGGTVKISEATLSFDKGATKSGSCTFNVGCVTENRDQNDTVTVVLNSGDVNASSGNKYSEPNMSNNKGTDGIRVKRDINLSVSIVDRQSWEDYIGNAPSKVKDAGKTQAVTTCSVSNHSRFNLYESDPMGDRITVNFYVNGNKVGSKNIPVPRYGSNLVWFKWDVPDGSSVTLKAEVVWNIDQENSANPYEDNSSSLSKGIKTVNKFSTPDTKLMMEHGSNKNYSKASAYSKFKPSVAKWSQWKCDERGTFTRFDYAMTGDSVLTLTPMKSAEYYDGNTIASGSAFSAVFSYTVRTECSEAGYDVSPNDYTYAQNVVAMFPEFQYTTSGDCRTMYLVAEDGNLGNASFCLEKNPYIEDKQRVHFTPSNMPDGEYKVGVVASSMWTPAGPIYVNAASSVMINGSVYDDWSPNASVK